MTGPLPPGARIGILGGGQLGRMLATDAARLGFDTHVFTPEADSPAGRVAARETIAAYEDVDALARFAREVDVVTSEFENVPAKTAEALLEAGALVRPGAAALATAQDRLIEKTFLREIGADVVAFRAIDGANDIATHLEALGAPALLKTRRLGYDGKGQVWVRAPSEARDAFAAIGMAPAILEAKASFEREVSVIAARSASGEIALFPFAQNRHEGGVLAESVAPAQVSAAVAAEIERVAKAALERLDYVGVLAIEFFLLPDDRLLANEFAPRVHNSGHWTREACVTGQFEQHIRAIAGWPLGETSLICGRARLRNLLGAQALDWTAFAKDHGARLTLYGKRDAVEGRKMGHVVWLE